MVPNFDGLASLFLFLAVLAVFGAWKLVEILLAVARWGFDAIDPAYWQACAIGALALAAALFLLHWLLFGRRGL